MVQFSYLDSKDELDNLSWFSRDEGEEIALIEHPSIVPYIDEFVVAIILIVGSLIGTVVGLFYFGIVALIGLVGVAAGILEGAKIYLQILNIFYIVTSKKIMIKRGIVRQDTDKAINYSQIQNISVEISVLERILGFILQRKYGDLHVSTAGESGDNMEFIGIRNPNQFKDVADDYV